MVATRDSLMKEIARLSFVLVETNLYLDGHPYNKEALRYYDRLSKELKEKTEEYEKKYGPITASGNREQQEWQWSTQNWPWHTEG